MRIKNFNIVIVLIAEILVAIYGYIYKYKLSKLVATMAVVFVIFFIIGTILQAMSNRIFAQIDEKAEKEDLLNEESKDLAEKEQEEEKFENGIDEE